MLSLKGFDIPPKVSFVLLSYNQSEYIADAISAALEQSYENIEFIFLDDCSKDNTFKIMAEISENSDRKIFFESNVTNLGLVGNFNKALSKASGDIIVVAAGDDISLANRVSETVKLFLDNENVSFLSFNDIKINSNNEELGRLDESLTSDSILTLEQFMQGQDLCFSGASRAFKRSLYDIFGDLILNCPTEDTPYRLRGLMLGHGMVCSSPGIMYRIHDANLSNASNLSKMNHDLVSAQYEKDVNFALSENFISISVASDLVLWSQYILNLKKLAFINMSFLKCSGYLKLFLKNKFFRAKVIRHFYK